MPTCLVTGATGYVGAALIPPLVDAGHPVRALARRPHAVGADVPVFPGDVVADEGLDAALDGVDVAYYLIHSMESASGDFGEDERRGAEHFAAAAVRAGVGRVVYLGGPVPDVDGVSRHLRSRLAVEEILLDAAPDAVAFRASIIIGARSRSFRFLVNLLGNAPFLPLPRWRDGRTRPLDERDMLAYLVRAATDADVTGRLALDLPGPDELSYGEMVDGIADLMLVRRPALKLGFNLTAIAAPFAAALAGEDVALIQPLMESLEHDTLPRDDRAQELFDVRLHRFERAVEHALAAWERAEPGTVAAR